MYAIKYYLLTYFFYLLTYLLAFNVMLNNDDK